MPRATATFNGQVIAEADAYEQVEGNVYFPPDSVKAKHALSDAELTTFCPWKGTASYYNIAVDGKPGLDFPQQASADSYQARKLRTRRGITHSRRLEKLRR